MCQRCHHPVQLLRGLCDAPRDAAHASVRTNCTPLALAPPWAISTHGLFVPPLLASNVHARPLPLPRSAAPWRSGWARRSDPAARCWAASPRRRRRWRARRRRCASA